MSLMMGGLQPGFVLDKFPVIVGDGSGPQAVNVSCPSIIVDIECSGDGREPLN